MARSLAILRVTHLVVASFLQKFVIDNSGLDGVYEVNDGNRRWDLGILEGLDPWFLSGSLEFAVYPIDDVVLHSSVGRLLRQNKKL